MHVFIDTNILLNFYHFTSDDFDILTSVFVSSEKGDVKVYLTDQVRDEFYRNRETKLRDALKQFRNFSLADQLPHFMRAYEEYGTLRALTKDFKFHAKNIQKKADADILNNDLHADHQIGGFFETLDVIETTGSIYADAVRRVDIGNPPGKKGSIGDAINWLLLLKYVPNGEDLFLIADDEDFRSNLFGNEPNAFLKREWREKKGADLHYFRNLNPFFDQHFDGVHVSYDSEKQELLDSLETCGSFAASHAVVAKLGQWKHYSFQEAKIVLEAANTNNQFGGIRGDPDIQQLFKNVFLPHQEKLSDLDQKGYLAELISLELDEDEDD